MVPVSSGHLQGLLAEGGAWRGRRPAAGGGGRHGATAQPAPACLEDYSSNGCARLCEAGVLGAPGLQELIPLAQVEVKAALLRVCCHPDRTTACAEATRRQNECAKPHDQRWISRTGMERREVIWI
jgi:hypothetical protein